MINNQIYITSVVKAINKAKKTGTLNLKVIQLFSLYKYYINFTKGKEDYYKLNNWLKQMISELMYRYPNEICNYKTIVIDTANISAINIRPEIGDKVINIGTEAHYTFTIADFTYNFTDANNDTYRSVIINPSGLTGSLLLGTSLDTAIQIFTPIEINLQNPLNVYYKRYDDPAFTNDALLIKVSDNNINSLYSVQHTIFMNGTEVLSNLPPVIGDITLYENNRAVTLITLPMLTSQLTPPYNDPEGDLIDAIRITEISTANQGTYYYNNLPVTPGLIISREDLVLGLFEHRGANVNTISSDIFSFQARDEGSQIWVE